MAKPHEHKHEHDHEHEEHAHEEIEDLNIEKDFNRLTLEEVVYGNQHVLNILLDLLIEKGIVSEQELKDKLDQMINDSPETAEVSNVKIDIPDEDEEARF
jgi:hypothetical protein